MQLQRGMFHMARLPGGDHNLCLQHLLLSGCGLDAGALLETGCRSDVLPACVVFNVVPAPYEDQIEVGRLHLRMLANSCR